MNTAVSPSAGSVVVRKRAKGPPDAIATQLRIDSLESTTAAASGYPVKAAVG